MLKKDSALSEDVSTSDFFSGGEDVIVLNHGNHWEYRGEIVSIDSANNTAMIRWEMTRKTKSVNMMDLQKYSVSEKSPRKRKPTEFFLPQPDAKISNENMSTEDEIKNKFYSHNNSAKLCAEGSLVNLLDRFGCCWAQGALPVLPQPQLQGASGTVLAAGFELLVSHSLC